MFIHSQKEMVPLGFDSKLVFPKEPNDRGVLEEVYSLLGGA